MSKELIERLRDTASKGVSVWGDLQKDAADLIEAQKTKIALQKGLIDGLLIVKREIGNEREALAAELAAARAQEPVAYRYKFTHPISGEPVWRDSSPTWNGQCVQEVQPLFAAPVPPVREPLSDNTIAALRQAIVQPARQVPTTNYVQPVPDHCDRITWRNRYYHLPLAAALPYGPRPTFGAIGSRDVDVAEAQRAWDKAMAAQPAQVPAGSIRLWDTQWASIVNHDNAYNGWSTNDAVNHAVRMTERYIAANVAQNNLPPLPAAQEVK
jgi:hypothetical protein